MDVVLLKEKDVPGSHSMRQFQQKSKTSIAERGTASCPVVPTGEEQILPNPTTTRRKIGTPDGDFSNDTEEPYVLKEEKGERQKESPDLPDENSNDEHHLHSLTEFFTAPEKLALEESDAVLSIEGNTFVVLPNEYNDGETLFRSVAQAVLDDEHEHYKIRDSVIDFAISQKGWDTLGYHIVPFYKNFIDEMKHGERYYGKQKEDFYKRVYRHYFVNKAIEGSLIELVGASLLYDFRYTCVFLQYDDEEPPKGKARFRVIHSFKTDDDTQGNVGSGSEEDEKAHHYFLRVGESPSNWVWSLLLPYTIPTKDQNEDEEIPRLKIPRGNYIGELWNVHGLNWNKEILPKKKLPTNFFRWKNGTTVIATNSGKLLAGYTTLGNDLFANLCWLLHRNFKYYSFLRNSVTKSSAKRASRFVCHPSQIILTDEAAQMKADAISSHLISCNEFSSIGTLEDLHKASKICKFGYFVIGINEKGELHNISKCTYRYDGKDILHFLVRTRKGVITRWCALQDMTTIAAPKEEVQAPTVDDKFQRDDTNTDCRPFTAKESISTMNSSRDLQRINWSGTNMMSRCLSRFQSLIMRVTDRNKVHQAHDSS